jgi:hypothetical protein|tara:strand:+ start:44 stop:313 length:270 start_codon:yes stop_codon:yes gene_type:complete
MGHIKLAKANGEFDVVTADGIIAVKENSDNTKIDVIYSGGTKCEITLAAAQATGDVFEVVKAIDVMEGASGPAPLVTLSQFVTGTDEGS